MFERTEWLRVGETYHAFRKGESLCGMDQGRVNARPPLPYPQPAYQHMMNTCAVCGKAAFRK